MRTEGLVVLAGVLILTAPSSAQEPDELTCEGQGTEPPTWFSEPPKPPPDVFQAEARSGGCQDTETAQKVTARVASWILLRQRGPRAILEQMRLRRQYLARPGNGQLHQNFTSVEESVAKRILARSWVHRQATRWTEKERAEHFLIVRADTAALRQVAPEELATDTKPWEEGRYLRGAELSWVSLDGSDGGHRAQRPARLRRAEAAPPSPALRPFVLSWETGPATWADSVPLLKLTGSATFSVTLTTQGSPWLLALGAEYRRSPDLELSLSDGPGQLSIRDSETWGLYGLLAVPHQAVPAYAGYQHRTYDLLGPGTTDGIERADHVLVAGLGVPPFTELRSARLKNAHLEVGVWPKHLSLAAGGTLRLVQWSGLVLNGVGRIRFAFQHLGEDAALGVNDFDDRGEVYLDAFRTQTGLEVMFTRIVGVWAVWRYGATTAKLTPEEDGDQLVTVERSARELGPKVSTSRFRVGVRLRF